MTDILFLEKNDASIAKVDRLEPLMRPYRNARDTWDYRSASALIYEAFTRYGIPLSAYRELPSGRPYIAGSQADFSVSHSGRYTVVAITTDPDVSIGIDIEETARASKRDIVGLSRRFFSEEEARSVAGAKDPVDTFLRLWTMKEALMKSRRVPLSQVLKTESRNATYIVNKNFIICIELYSPHR